MRVASLNDSLQAVVNESATVIEGDVVHVPDAATSRDDTGASDTDADTSTAVTAADAEVSGVRLCNGRAEVNDATAEVVAVSETDALDTGTDAADGDGSSGRSELGHADGDADGDREAAVITDVVGVEVAAASEPGEAVVVVPNATVGVALDVTADAGGPVGIAAAAADADTVAVVVVVAGAEMVAVSVKAAVAEDGSDGGSDMESVAVGVGVSAAEGVAIVVAVGLAVSVADAETVDVSVTEAVSDEDGVAVDSSATDRATVAVAVGDDSSVLVAVGDAVGDVECVVYVVTVSVALRVPVRDSVSVKDGEPLAVTLAVAVDSGTGVALADPVTLRVAAALREVVGDTAAVDGVPELVTVSERVAVSLGECRADTDTVADGDTSSVTDGDADGSMDDEAEAMRVAVSGAVPDALHDAVVEGVGLPVDVVVAEPVAVKVGGAVHDAVEVWDAVGVVDAVACGVVGATLRERVAVKLDVCNTTRRMRWPYASAISRLLEASHATLMGASAADVAAMPSGDDAATPVPATFVTAWVTASTRRT